MSRIVSKHSQPACSNVYQTIRKAILCGDYPPGKRLTEEKLARELGISRTPVREALRKLEVENMVNHNPNKGVVVAEVNSDQRDDLYEIRALVESLVVKRAAQNITVEGAARLNELLDKEEAASSPDEIYEFVNDFHLALIEIADCPEISNLLIKIRETLRLMIRTTAIKPERRPVMQREHRLIVEAIANGDAQLAQSLTISHVYGAKRVLEKSEH